MTIAKGPADDGVGTAPSSSLPPVPAEPVRLDKWLWSVRLFKTRTLAAGACQGGHVKISSQRVKPAHHVRPGEMIEIRQPAGTRLIRVLALLDRRVGAALVPRYLQDLTPPAPPATGDGPAPEPVLTRPRGAGRPTKRDRRLLEQSGLLPRDE